MKKYIIPVVIFFIVVIGGIIFAVSINYNKVQYQKDTRFHVMTLKKTGILTAKYNNIETLIAPENIQKIYTSLTVKDIIFLFTMPKFDESKSIYLNFSDGGKYVIARNTEDTKNTDSVFIIYEYKTRKVIFKLSGYNTFYWIEKSISPEGLYAKNKIL